ncbi:hypothetical protein GMDG_01489 [Pseudogymnoascus destructans 20631-21]|uniref:SET domain-containing protein n=1 Tax=Pseudogymnoascus destructans (strain ATCC MYA-4855 / 20631-21) TaxID=658429 RepID=L8FVA8_PSED2|nr:hypothetical protein GMDG_01489 [Pseudogymnoascus destructans 20631-21]
MPPELKVGYFEAAESAIDGLDPNPESLKLQAEVFYNLARYDECIECLGKLPKPDSALLEKAKTRLVEQQTGAYDFRSIFAELPTLNPPTVNRATYIGPVDIRVSPGKGRGLFTTRASAPAEMHKTKLYMVFNTEEESIIFGTLGTLITEAVQKPKRAYSSGLWPLCATLNHSCLPTARRTFIGDLQVVCDTRDLPADTELVWAYNEVSEDPAQTRSALANWGFVCSCSLCAEVVRTPEKVKEVVELWGIAGSIREGWSGVGNIL